MARAQEDLLTGDLLPKHRIESPVLCVDLDAAYLRSDTFYENLLVAITAHPSVFFKIPIWLARGQVQMRQAFTECARDLSQSAVCPRQPEVVELIDAARRA